MICSDRHERISEFITDVFYGKDIDSEKILYLNANNIIGYVRRLRLYKGKRMPALLRDVEIVVGNHRDLNILARDMNEEGFKLSK